MRITRLVLFAVIWTKQGGDSRYNGEVVDFVGLIGIRNFCDQYQENYEGSRSVSAEVPF